MTTTTIRVDAETHARLIELGQAAGTSLIDTVRDAAEALRRQRFGHQLTSELAELRRNHTAWASYLAEVESSAVTDGIGPTLRSVAMWWWRGSGSRPGSANVIQ